MDCLNAAFITLNALMLMVGVTLFGCGIWLVTRSHYIYGSHASYTAVFQVGVSFIIVVGALSVLLSFLGCRAVYKRNKPLPNCQALIILCMVVFECAVITLVSLFFVTLQRMYWADNKTKIMTNAVLGLTGVLLFLQVCVLVLFALRNNLCNKKAAIVLEKLEDKISNYLPNSYKHSTTNYLVPKAHAENIVYD